MLNNDSTQGYSISHAAKTTVTPGVVPLRSLLLPLSLLAHNPVGHSARIGYISSSLCIRYSSYVFRIPFLSPRRALVIASRIC